MGSKTAIAAGLLTGVLVGGLIVGGLVALLPGTGPAEPEAAGPTTAPAATAVPAATASPATTPTPAMTPTPAESAGAASSPAATGSPGSTASASPGAPASSPSVPVEASPSTSTSAFRVGKAAPSPTVAKVGGGTIDLAALTGKDGIVGDGALGGLRPDVMATGLASILPGVSVTP